jgi:hypothetical protein
LFSLGGDEGDEKLVTLASDRAQLEQAPVFVTGKKHSIEMCEPAWVARVHKHFAVKPYWNGARAPSGSLGSGK